NRHARKRAKLLKLSCAAFQQNCHFTTVRYAQQAGAGMSERSRFRASRTCGKDFQRVSVPRSVVIDRLAVRSEARAISDHTADSSLMIARLGNRFLARPDKNSARKTCHKRDAC